MMTKRHPWPVTLFDRVVLGHPRVVIVFLLLAVGFLGFQARLFRLDASADTLVLEDDSDLRYARAVSERYGSQDFVVVTYRPLGELFSEESLNALRRLREQLKALDCVASVRTILDVPLLASPPISLQSIKEGLPNYDSPAADKAAAPNELRNSPLYQNLLISPDARTTALLVDFHDDAPVPADQADRQRHEDITAIRAVMDRNRGQAELFLGGVKMIADDMITFIKSDLKIFGLGGAAALVIMLGWIFRRPRWILLPMLCCAASAVSIIGLLGWLEWPVTVISSNFISLQLIITMAIAIHLVVRYRELLAASPSADNRQLVLETVRLKFKPCVFAVLTTMVGFGSLLLCDILPVIMLGWMMMVGLTVSLVTTFLIFPSVLVMLPRETPPRGGGRCGWLTRGLARLTEAAKGPIIGVSVLVMVASVIGISRLRVENCFIDYFRPTTEIYRGMKVIDEQFGGTTPLDVIVEFDGPAAPEAVEGWADDDDDFGEFDELDESAADERYWFTAEKMARVKAAHRYLDRLPETGKVLSLATAMEIAEQLNDGKPLDSFELALLYAKTPGQFKTMLVDPYVSVEHNQVRLSVRVKDSSKSLRRDELLKRIQAELPEVVGVKDDQVRLAGMLVLYNNMLQSLFGSQVLTLGITVALLSGMFLVLFRSWRVALIAMGPNVLPVAVVLGVMGWLDIPLDMMTITIAAIGVGIAVDDTIHYLHRFKEEFAMDRAYLPAMHRCHASIGRAMYYTSISITLGLVILSWSNFIPTVSFGLLTGLAMIVALLADLTVLPAMLVLARPFGKGASPLPAGRPEGK